MATYRTSMRTCGNAIDTSGRNCRYVYTCFSLETRMLIQHLILLHTKLLCIPSSFVKCTYMYNIMKCNARKTICITNCINIFVYLLKDNNT